MKNKKTLETHQTNSNFDLKFILVSSPGQGKTHFCGTYTRGPIHFYMLDPGGEKTLYKLNQNRPEKAPITIDRFVRSEGASYETFWKQIQQDSKDNFFDEMAKENGIVVFDSMTNLSLLALDSIAKLNGRHPGNPPEKSGMRRQDWGQRSAWLTEFFRVVSELPCAAIITCHLKRVQNEQTGAITEQLALPGQLQDSGANWFDEVYKIAPVAKSIRISFRNAGAFDQAKTRVFQDDSVDFRRGDLILDKLLEVYYSGGKFQEEVSPKSKKAQNN